MEYRTDTSLRPALSSEPIPKLKQNKALGTKTDSEDQTSSEHTCETDATKFQQWFRWHEPGTTRSEKTLIFKLDCFILLYTCLTFFIKYLEQTSVTNAYVSGMKEDLHLHSNQLNWFTTYYNIGIIVGSPFTTFALAVVPPMYWLPASTVLSSVFVLSMYKANNAATVYGLRFAVGLCSSAIQPAGYYLIGSWYRKSEIARRSALFTISSYIGGMISGYIQAGLYSGMNGRDGIAAWRWLFIFNAILGLPVALFGVLCCPNEPNFKKRWWMSDSERMICIERMEQEHRIPNSKLEKASAKRVLSSWQLYCFPIAAGLKELTAGTEMSRWMALYITASKNYSREKANTLPTTVPCAEIIITFVASTIVDWSQRPDIVILAFGSLQIYGYAVFAAWPASNAWKISNYIIAGAFYSAITPIISAWANSRCANDKHLRATVNGLITTVGYLCETLSQQFFFQVKDAPSFERTGGYIWGACWAAAMIAWCVAIIPLIERPGCRHAIRRTLACFR